MELCSVRVNPHQMIVPTELKYQTLTEKFDFWVYCGVVQALNGSSATTIQGGPCMILGFYTACWVEFR